MPQAGPPTAAENAEATAAATKAGRVDGPREETSLLAFFSILLAHRRLVAFCALAGTLLFGLLTISQASLYESRASYVVRGSRPVAQLPGQAAALGLGLAAAAEFSQSIVFYSDLARANTILTAVAGKTYETSDGRKRTLASIYGIDEKDPHKAAVEAGKRLAENVSSSIYSRSGIVSVSVRAADPLVAQELATNILKELDTFSVGRRHLQAVQERKFIEGLVAEARSRLAQAEAALGGFLRVNAEYFTSPQLRLENDRLTRDVNQQQMIYVSLAQSLEQAKIDEARDHSALSIVETADLPAEPQRREALRMALLGLSVGLFVGIVLAFLRQRMLETRNAATPGFMQFSAAAEETGASLPPLLRPRTSSTT